MILCVTHSKDTYTIDRVLAYFKKVNQPAIRFNTDEYLMNSSITQEASDIDWNIVLKIKEVEIHFHEIKGVWFRKLWTPKILEEIQEDYQRSVGAEIQSTLFSFFNLLEKNVPCINKSSLDISIGKDKYLQLQIAQRVGQLIPETIITSCYNTVVNFFNKNDQNIIAKLQNSLSFSMGKGDLFFPTTKLKAENLELLKGTLNCCPMIFQANIPKAYELRVAYIEGTCFTGKINATNSENGKTDWRNSETTETLWESYKLPQIEEEKIDELMRLLGLSFGAIDLIRNLEGDYVFLEVNPSGEWGMLELYLDYPIAETIAKKLLNKIKYNEK